MEVSNVMVVGVSDAIIVGVSDVIVVGVGDVIVAAGNGGSELLVVVNTYRPWNTTSSDT